MAKLLSGTRIYGNTTVDTQLFVNGSNASTSNTTGALIVTGGVGVSGNLYVGNVVSLGNITVTNTITTKNLTANTIIFPDNTIQNTAWTGADVYAREKVNAAFDVANTDVTSVSITANTYGDSGSTLIPTIAANGRITAITVEPIRTAQQETAGIVRLSDSINGVANTLSGNAATPWAVNQVYTVASAAFDTANSKAANAFTSILVDGQDTITANSNSSPLTFVSGQGIAVTTDAISRTITVSAAAGAGDIWTDQSDFELITDLVTLESDLGLVTGSVDVQIDLGSLVVGGLIFPSLFVLPTYTVSTLPNVIPAGQLILVTDESGGAVPSFSDGTNWRRMTDRAIVS